MTQLSPNAELVRCLLTGVPVIGAEPDMSALTDAELGALACLAWAPDAHGVHASQLSAVLRGRAPVFTEHAAVAALHALTEGAQRRVAADQPALLQWVIEAAAQVVCGCAEVSEPPVHGALSTLVVLGLGPVLDLLDVALLTCAGHDAPAHPGELGRKERRFLTSLVSPRDRIQMGRVRSAWNFAVDDDELTPRGADPLALLPGYLAFAERLTTMALEHARAIQSGAVPYAADKAFAHDEPHAVHAALRAGLDQGKPWAREAAIPLLAGLSVAPLDRAKTVPSQSASIAVAKAIAERPSAPLVAEMKATVAKVRHAGLKKKLARFLAVAERRLFEHDDFLLELDPGATIPKALAGTVTRAIEALFLRPAPLPFDAWKDRILGNKTAAKRAACLVWRSDSGTAFVPVRKGARWVFVGSDGSPRTPSHGTVALWHPLQPDADASAWRAWVLEQQVQQPFNQLFRETYSPNSVASLLVPELDVKTLLGLARSQGWVLRDERLVRRMGPCRVELEVGRVFPGAQGTTRCFSLQLFHGVERQSLDLSTEDPQVVSECLRTVDLLVGVSSFALDPAQSVETTSARERRAVLTRMLGAEAGSERPFVDGHHVRCGDLSISIATGRASRDGEEVELPRVAAGVAVIPYPDETLYRIVRALNAHTRG
ncbi:MAG: DUF4132 domain-containing protein [Polyangiales bacterium]|nr:DUF4132 domain-containing protein [Sandaracinaceae bacterium]